MTDRDWLLQHLLEFDDEADVREHLHGTHGRDGVAVDRARLDDMAHRELDGLHLELHKGGRS